MLQRCDHCVVSRAALKSLVQKQMGENYETPVSVIADPVGTRLADALLNPKARIFPFCLVRELHGLSKYRPCEYRCERLDGVVIQAI